MQEQSCGHFHFQAWIPLATESLTSLSAQNLFADIAKHDKRADRADSAVAMSSRCWSLGATPSPVCMRSMFIIFSNGSIIPPGFKLMELHTLTLAARSYALLLVTSHCTLRSFCVSRKGGTGDGGWGHPQGEMHMVAAKLGCQSTMVEDLPWLGPYVQILTLAVWTGIENATLPL